MRADLHLHLSQPDDADSFRFLQQEAEKVGIDWIVQTEPDCWPRFFDLRHSQKIYGVQITSDLIGSSAPVLAYFTKEPKGILDFLFEQQKRKGLSSVIGYPTTPLVISMVKSLGGLAFLAKPGRLTITLDLIREFRHSGLDGIEVYSPFHTETEVGMYHQFCIKESLLEVGGSDMGRNPEGRTGPVAMGFSWVEGEDLEKFLMALFG